MFLLPNPFFFLEFQIWHYKTRLAEETNPDARAFLRQELYNLQQRLATYYN